MAINTTNTASTSLSTKIGSNSGTLKALENNPVGIVGDTIETGGPIKSTHSTMSNFLATKGANIKGTISLPS